MRVYALLLGIVFTASYGFAAQLAVSSVGPGRQSDTAPASASQELDRVWYGGVIDPITVESAGGAATAAVTKTRLLYRPTLRCTVTGRAGYRAIIS